MIHLKTEKEISMMKESGSILSEVMFLLLDSMKVGISMGELDRLAEKEIIKRGAVPSFQMVPGYRWSICSCVNDIVVHGIPGPYKIREDDLVGIDMGVFYRGYHSDSSWSVRVGQGKTEKAKEIDKFLRVGRLALVNAIKQVKSGNYIYDISKAIETTVNNANYSVVRSLIGHGIGKKLHEEPEVPGVVTKPREKTFKIVPGLTIAVEVIYNLGSNEVDFKSKDGWTIRTKDGKISGLFETTVAATNHGVILLSKNYGPSGDN